MGQGSFVYHLPPELKQTFTAFKPTMLRQSRSTGESTVRSTMTSRSRVRSPDCIEHMLQEDDYIGVRLESKALVYYGHMWKV